MAIDNSEQDLPLEEEGASQDLPLESLGNPVSTGSDTMDSLYRGQAAVLKSEIEEVDILKAMDRLDTETAPRTLVNQYAAQRAEQGKEDLKAYFDRNLGNSPEEVADNISLYQELLSEDESASSKPSKQVVEAMRGLEVPDIESKGLEADLLLMDTINDMITNYTTFDKVVDFGKMLLPSAIVDNVQLTGSPFDAESFVRELVVGMKDLRRNDPEKFLEVFPALVQTLEEDLPTGKSLQVLGAIASIRGETELGDTFGPLTASLDAVDLASLGTYSAFKIARLSQRLNAIRVAKKLNNAELAADINSAALLDETGSIRNALGLDEITVANNAAPFNVGELDTAQALNISTDTVSRINRVKAHQKRVSEIIRSQDGLLREDLLSPAERLVAEEKFSDQMKTMGLDNVRMIKQDRDGTMFAYTIKDPDTGLDIAEISDMSLKIDDITGHWTKTEQGVFSSYMASPTVFAKNATEDVNSAIRLDSTSSVIGEMFKKLQTEALAPIFNQSRLRAFSPKARKQLAELDEVLRAGDEYKDASGVRGKVYTPDELRGGVVGGLKLSDEQMEAYYNIRNLYDELWTIRNDETRRTLKAQGKGEIRVNGAPQVGKTFSQEGATGVLNSNGQVKVYHAGLDEVITINGKDVAKYYGEGSVISRLDSPIKPLDDTDELFDLVITGSKESGDLPSKVLHFRPGYVPKVNKGAYWFVKETGDVTVNGVTKTNQVTKTVRMFSSRTEAQRWVAEQGKNNLVALPDRALEQQVLGSSQLGSGGGLYTGARASEDIPFGPEGLPGERLNTYEALAQNLQSLENYVSRNQWRMAMQQKWINSARHAFPEQSIDRFEKALIPDGDSRGDYLRRMANQIEVWSGFPTRGEQLWDGFVSGTMEFMLNSRLVPLKDKTIVRGANYLRRRENDPVAMARSVAFHNLLGVLNPAQVWVQAQGASISASLSKSPLKAFKHQTAIGTAEHFGTDSKAFKVVSDSFGMDVQELKDLTALWKRTGLGTSIDNTADLAAASKGFGVGRTAMRQMFDKGLFFYRAGELFNRRYAFVVALERYQTKTGKTVKSIGDTELKGILSEANNLMLNLSKANRASWQRGVLAITTQFLQVQTKFAETLLGLNNAFTLRERGRMLAGQVMLYGAAGIPFGNLGVRWAQEALGISQHDIDNAPPGTIDAINGGMWQLFATQWLGADVELSSRGAISQGMTEFTLDLMFSEATIGEKVVGAFGIVPHRGFSAWKEIKPMIFNKSEEPMTTDEILQAMSTLLSVTSTWNNLQKGLMMSRYDELLDSRGNVVESRDFDTKQEIMVMIGFQPSELRRVRDREALVRASKEYRAQVADAVVDHYWNYVQVLRGVENDTEREKIIKNYASGTQFLLSTLRNEEEVRKVRQAVNDRLENQDDRKARSIRAYIEEFSDSRVLDLHSMTSAARTNGLIQMNDAMEEDEE